MNEKNKLININRIKSHLNTKIYTNKLNKIVKLKYEKL